MKGNCCCRSEKWDATDIGKQNGKNIVITGGNSGIGYYTALELGRAGANVVIACRDAVRGAAALSKLKKEAPNAQISLETLDLSDLVSIRLFAGKYLATGKQLDVLVNNAGIMALPQREKTDEGFEKQFGTNHLGHFALTGLLLPALRKSPAPRVVVVSSSAASFGTIELDNLQSERLYKPMRSYAQSKLANLAFMLELGKRLPWLTSVASHPGGAATNLQKYKFRRLTNLLGQHASQGALPSLRAAVEETATGTFYGPGHWFHMRGAPVLVGLPRGTKNEELNGALWQESVRLTGVNYQL
jgi:NAD(P)-dependent dehydrogenase (short-subunit alcohol dehydrogenase family)